MPLKPATLALGSIVAAAALAGMLAGCSNREEAVKEAPGQQPSVARSAAGAPADEERAKRFLADLEAQPAEKRGSYVEAHKAEASLASQSKDQTTTARFYSLMMPKMAMPK